MKIDCYGNQMGSAKYLNDSTTSPVSVRETGKDTYLKFTKFNPCPIQKVVYIGPTENDIDLRWAYGDWNKKETLDYNMDLNTPYDTDNYRP